VAEVSCPLSKRTTTHARLKIDDIFLLSIEYCFLASYSSIGDKLVYIDRAISRVDLLKLLLLLAFEMKAIDIKKYMHISEGFDEVGKMLGGWRRQTLQKTSHESEKKK
jgi:hypothetical protein